jgi:nucleoside-diphosphate-sugar epimerase
MGTFLSRHLAGRIPRLRLIYHRTPLASDVLEADGVEAVRADLGDPRTIPPAVQGVDVVVHFAGVLFAPRPSRFLPVTNVKWFEHLLDAAVAAGVRKVILVSFPQVEGPTTFERPATGRLDRKPVSVHATTRLEAERLLMSRTQSTQTVPIVLRLGLVTLETSSPSPSRNSWTACAQRGLLTALAGADVDRARNRRRVRALRACRTDASAADTRHRGAGAGVPLGRDDARPGRASPRAHLPNTFDRPSTLPMTAGVSP